MLQDSKAALHFIDKIIEAKGLDSLEEEIRVQLRADLLRQLEETVSRNILDSLPKEKLQVFSHILDTNDIDKIQHFLHNEGIHIHEVLARSMGEFQTKYLEV
jgi:uncharacterized protein DUF5663